MEGTSGGLDVQAPRRTNKLRLTQWILCSRVELCENPQHDFEEGTYLDSDRLTVMTVRESL